MNNPKTTPHKILMKKINPNAIKVLKRLNEAGYTAYLVGGGVRDLLLDLHPKDFDVATNARPQEIKKLFRNCLLIGKRFRLAHIRFGNEIVEVATFRADHSKALGSNDGLSKNGLILRDNVYGTLEEDAFRRDFSINALYYNIHDNNIVDYCDGLKDIQKKQIRMIGEPEKRYQEDPVRFLRAIRFAAKLNFKIEKKTEQPLFKMSYLLHQTSPARLFDEVIKLFLTGHAEKTFELLCHYDFFKELFPAPAYVLSQASHYPLFMPKKLLTLAMKNSDARIAQDKSLNPGFLFSVLLWYPFRIELKRGIEYGLTHHDAIDDAISTTLKEQSTATAIPKRFTEMIQEVWRCQFLFDEPLTQRTATRIAQSTRFRAAFDFFLMRFEAEEHIPKHLAEWWENFAVAPEDVQHGLIEALPKAKKRS